MSKPWGNLGSGIGSWAAEAEREEAEERENATTTTTRTTATNPQSFPSLKESITAKPKKKKAMSLSEFYSGSSVGSTRLTPAEMLQLPTAPKARAPDEYSSGGPRLGGGFSSYGDDRRPPPRRGFDDDRRPKRGDFDDNMMMPPPPSRADEVDNWASVKKPISMVDRPTSGGGGGGGGSRYGQLGGGSRADEVDNWNLGKKSQVQVQVQSLGVVSRERSSSFGSGFRVDSGSDMELGRRRLVLDPPSGRNGEAEEMKATGSKANPFGAARPREELLAEKGLDWKKVDMEMEAKKGWVGGSSSGSRPTSSQGSRPTSSQSNRGAESGGGGGGGNGEVKPRPKVNPFGDAKPREVLLEEKGLDWRKIDLELEHRRIDRLVGFQLEFWL